MNTLTVTLRGLYVIVTVNYNMLIDFEVHYSVCLLIHLSLNLWFLLVNIKMRLHSLSTGGITDLWIPSGRTELDIYCSLVTQNRRMMYVTSHLYRLVSLSELDDGDIDFPFELLCIIFVTF